MKKHGNGILAKAAMAVGTVWMVNNPHGALDVHGTPVHVCARMSEHAVKGAILVDAGDKAAVVDWLGPKSFKIRLTTKRPRDY